MFCNPSFLLKAGDFNARTSFCCRRDLAASEGTQNEALICSYGLNQFIPSPIQTLQN